MAVIPAPEFHNFVHGFKSKFLFMPASGDPTADDRYLFDIEQATFNHECDDDDITHTGAGGYQDILPGVKRASGQVTFVYDASSEFALAPNVFQVGGYAWLFLEPFPGQTRYFYAMFSSASFPIGPKAGAVRVTVNYKSKGRVFEPTTSQPPVTAST